MSKDNTLEVYVVISRKKIEAFLNFTRYDARVRGSVFKIKCRVLSREFEPFQTPPASWRKLELKKKSIIKIMLEKICQMTNV